jgi:hypothetical protein
MKILHLTIILLFVTSCAPSQPIELTFEAGFRYSTYGPTYNPGPEYWPEVGKQMAAKFPGAKPATIWIIGNVNGDGIYLNLPCETEDPNIRCGFVDMNEDLLTTFDEQGFDVWLQVEAGNADMLELIDIVLHQYKHHPSVVGFGVDVEWYQSTDGPEGTPISDEVAESWVKAIRKHNRNYMLFLKHWDARWMPPNVRDGILFVNDSQQFESFDQMITDFTEWGRIFDPAPVGFQYGYQSDKIWWKYMQDPPKEIGQTLIDKIPNTKGLFWVDFTVTEVFPPE